MKSIVYFLFLLCIFIPSLHAQWNPWQTPDGANTNRLWQSEGRLFCTTSRGSYFSDDEGASWDRAFTNDYAKGGFSHLYSHDSVIVARIANGALEIWEMVISTNNGDSWSILPTPDNGATEFPDIGFNGKTILYSTNTATYRSEDFGEHWTLMNETELPFTFTNLVTSGGLFFARKTDGSVWGSDSTGTKWDSLTFQDGTYEFQYIYRDADILLVGVTKGQVHYSYDEGETWNFSENINIFQSAGEGFYRHGDTLYMLHNSRIYQSLDMAVSWQLKSPQTRRITDIIPGNGYTLFAETDIYKSYDYGQTVIPSSDGINNRTLFHLQIDGHRAWYESNYQLSTGFVSNEQLELDSVILPDFNLDEIIDGDGYAFIDETYSEGLENWTRILRVSPEGELKVVLEEDASTWLSSDHLKYTDGKLFYFIGGSFMYSLDKGDTWLPQSDFGIVPNFDIERHENALFCISSNGVLRRMDGQQDWVDVNQGLNTVAEPIETGTLQTRLFSTEGALFLQLVREDDNDLIEIYVSHNLGDSWQRILSEYPDIPAPYLNSPVTIKNIITIPGYHVIALRDIGVLISADQGLTWTLYNDGLPTVFGWQVQDLEKYDTMAIVSLKEDGLWRLTTDDITKIFSGGKVYHDTNHNGTLSSGEPGIKFVKVFLQGEGLLDFTDNAGSYGFYHDDLDSLTVMPENPYVTIVPGEHLTTDQSRHFGFQLNADVYDLAVDLYADQEHRPGNTIKYYLVYRNLGKEVTNATIVLNHSELMSFVSADHPHVQITDNFLRFDIEPLGRLESGRVVINFLVDQDAPLSAQVQTSCIATIDEDDNDFLNNAALVIDVITGPFDPNDITVDLDKVSVQQVANGQKLRYMIRFQNVGTSYAEDVNIENHISQLLDVTSISGFLASHPFLLTYDQDNLVFSFDGIMLPDSVADEAGSHGFVAYDILIDKEAKAGDTIKNFADIFFDFNLPVRTNTAHTVIEEINSVAWPEQYGRLVISPNPSNKTDVVKISEPNLPGVIHIVDIQGQMRYANENYSANDPIDVSRLASGVYFISLQSSGESYFAKLIVQ